MINQTSPHPTVSGGQLPTPVKDSEQWWTDSSQNQLLVLPQMHEAGVEWWRSPEKAEEIEHLGAVSIIGANAEAAVQEKVEAPNLPDTADQLLHAERAHLAAEGWKLHLNFDPTNQKHIHKMREVLTELKSNEDGLHFKIGEGGGAAQDSEGKEATVYVGSMKDTIRIAELLEEQLRGIILPAVSETLMHDIPFTQNGMVWGRFSVLRTQPVQVGDPTRFMQWGPNGVPMMSYHTMAKDMTDTQVAAESADSAKKYYGSFFDANGAYQKMLANKRLLLQI